MENETPPDKQGVLELLATLSAQGRSGRLEIAAGAVEGALLLQHGKLVDARIGHLTGFQAMNAIASLRDARFQFHPSVIPPVSGSITANERVVLKQFFGIEAVDSTNYSVPPTASETDEATVTSRVISAPIDVATTKPDVTTPPSDVANLITLPAVSSRSRSWGSYLAVLALSAVAIALVAAAVFLKHAYRARTSSESIAKVETPKSVNPVKPASSVAPVESAPTPTAAETKVDHTPTSASANISGTWNVVNTVQTTSYKSFQNMQVGFVMSITQNGTAFTARGQKVSENGRSLPASSRTPIHVQGFIKGDEVQANFVEEGAVRTTKGRFVWKLNRAGGALTGTFATSAARASGRSSGRRET